MGKRYKEFLIDVLTKAYQIILAIVIVTPLVTRRFDTIQIGLGVSLVALLLICAGAVSVRLEE